MTDTKKSSRKSGTWQFAGALSTPGGSAPTFQLPEFAFAGRSNVGKSTLINRLTRSPGLARTSSTPGRTQQINFFLLPERMVFADLPGYGFARVPERIRATWKPLFEAYFRSRETLRGIVVILDARRGLGAEDETLLEFAANCSRPVIVAANKIDKLRQGERTLLLRDLAARLPDVVPFSAVTGEGERELWRRLTAFAGVR